MNFALNLTPSQTLAMTACMLAISHVDGVHPAETSLIEDFYRSGYEQGMLAFDQVQGTHLAADALLEPLKNEPEFAEILINMCLMTGYADGRLSDAERSASFRFGQLAGLSEDQCLAALSSVRDALLGSLSHLPDSASVAALAGEL